MLSQQPQVTAPRRGEVLMDVLAFRRDGAGVFAGLNAFIGFKRDNRLMMTFAACDAPRLMFDIACVDHVFEQIAYPLLPDFAVGQAFREAGCASKKRRNSAWVVMRPEA